MGTNLRNTFACITHNTHKHTHTERERERVKAKRATIGGSKTCSRLPLLCRLRLFFVAREMRIWGNRRRVTLRLASEMCEEKKNFREEEEEEETRVVIPR